MKGWQSEVNSSCLKNTCKELFGAEMVELALKF